MFQTFEKRGGAAIGRRNLPKVRKALRAQGLDGFIIPHEDEYQNEYMPQAHERLAWATGFSGSAGCAVVLHDRAAIFIDGRYLVQIVKQTDGDLFAHERLEDDGVATWLRGTLKAGQIIGFDPKLHTPDALAKLTAAAAQAGATLKPVAENPVDAAWGADRPPLPEGPATPHPMDFAGVSHGDKLAALRDDLGANGLDAVVITDPMSTCWLLNIRGTDAPRTPLVLSTTLVRREGPARVFLDPGKVTADLKAHWGDAVEIQPMDALPGALSSLRGLRVSLDPARASAWVFDRLQDAGAIIARNPDPCALPRARKNSVEIAGAQAAHRRDGAAMAAFLHWLDAAGGDGITDEIIAAQHLEIFRRETGKLEDLSFDTISGAAGNGAIIHYRVNEKSNRKLRRGQLYITDSGGQYRDGTTDITRTIAIGRPKKEMRERYTQVLKAHIAMSTIRFPKGTSGLQLDAIARQHVWMAGLDYDHGTGHGVGSFLGVHEGPQRIGARASMVPLQPGMIVSNEPGYYKPGAYGIRIENLQVVTEPAPIEGGDRDMMGFSPLTLAPYDRTLIVRAMLTKAERAFVDAYHARVWDEVGPLTPAPVAAWLQQACAPLAVQVKTENARA